jgi:hypothetical protein
MAKKKANVKAWMEKLSTGQIMLDPITALLIIIIILFVSRIAIFLLPWVVLFSVILWLFPIVGTNTFSFDRGSKTGFDDSQNLSSKMTGEEKDLSKLHSILELQKEGWKFANKIPIEEFMEVYPNWNKMNGQARASALRVYGIQKNQ